MLSQGDLLTSAVFYYQKYAIGKYFLILSFNWTWIMFRKCFSSKWEPGTIRLNSNGIIKRFTNDYEQSINLNKVAHLVKHGYDADQCYGAPQLPDEASISLLMCIPSNIRLIKREMWWLLFKNPGDVS